MSDQDVYRDGKRRRRGRRRAVRIGVLLGILAALVIYLALPGAAGPTTARGMRSPALRAGSHQGHPEGSSRRCAKTSRRVVPQRVARLYEEGTVRSASVWTDEEPAPPAVSPLAPRPGGYEMRWWAPNGDDVVADALVFANAAGAQRFLALASSTRCRREGRRQSTATPPLGTNVSWLNPDGAAQADVYLARGARVYRLADAPAGQRGGALRPGSLGRAFATIDALACLLPGAHCAAVNQSVVPA